MKIALGQQGFQGEQPRIEPCLLPDVRAKDAEMTRLTTGDLEAWNEIEVGPILPKSVIIDGEAP